MKFGLFGCYSFYSLFFFSFVSFNDNSCIFFRTYFGLCAPCHHCIDNVWPGKKQQQQQLNAQKHAAESRGLIILRVLSGLGEGTMYSGLTDLLAAWVPLTERTTLGSLAYGGSTVNTYYHAARGQIVCALVKWSIMFNLRFFILISHLYETH